jgi:deazaflavin-dependent oxidoreductase (nitroreductase family)
MPLDGEYAPNPMAWVREHVEMYESSGGTDGVIVNGDPTVILTSRGAKSGLLRKSPVMRVEHDGAYAVVGSLGGRPMNPAWVANLRAHPHVELQDGPVKQDWTARELAGTERAVVGARGGGVLELRGLPGQDRQGDPGLPPRAAGLTTALGRARAQTSRAARPHEEFTRAQ